MRRGRLPDRKAPAFSHADCAYRMMSSGTELLAAIFWAVEPMERGAQVAVAVRAHEEQVERRVFGVVGDHFAGVAVKRTGRG